MKKIILLTITLSVFILSSCSDSTPVRVKIIDKSFNKNQVFASDKDAITPYKDLSTNIKVKNKVKTKVKTPIKTTKKIINKKYSKSWIMPINAPISKGFSKKNQGLTFNSVENLKVSAVNDGEIVYSGNNLKLYGFMIVIKHKYGFYTHYMFNKKALIKVGDKVKKGQTIAVTGKEHFHFSMRKYTTIVNPLNYIYAK